MAATTAAIVCMAMAAVNVALALSSHGGPIQWAAAAFCFGLGVVTAIRR